MSMEIEDEILFNLKQSKEKWMCFQEEYLKKNRG